ncbi:MAG: DUF1538 domain-containing protein [Synergistaceae bacterium]|nr:DUF1538 domain-containing protein [Synergistota bacterium]NLM72352.1 DUF1538 domain-containing protein [Synergistaceae bacterium]
MYFIEKIKEISISVVPVLLLVLLLYPTIAPIGTTLLIQCFIGGALIIVGLAFFLIGSDIGVLPMGHLVGAELMQRRNVWLLLLSGFIIGFSVTVAEPDVHVLANQVAAVAPSISRSGLVLMIATGLALYVSAGIGRVLRRTPYYYLVLGSYLPLFAIAYFSAPQYLGIAFDAGGATTGPMAVPVIMAMGVGVASVQGASEREESSFGFVGLASIGPIMAVLVLGLFAKGAPIHVTVPPLPVGADSVAAAFLNVLPETIIEVTMVLGPLAAILVVFQVTLLKMSRRRFLRMVKGILLSFIGLILFFIGVNGGFLPAGTAIGGKIGASPMSWLLFPVGLTLGAIVVLAEPAVWILNELVEEVSGGHITRRLILIALSIGVSVSVGISMLRILYSLSIWWFLIPGYLLAMLLTLFSPPLFTAIAFDSGGVASGPMGSTFVLSFTLGASSAFGGDPVMDAFGVVGMIAMTPLITIQILGILFKRKEEEARMAAEQPMEVLHDDD